MICSFSAVWGADRKTCSGELQAVAAREAYVPPDHTTAWNDWFVHPNGRGHEFVLKAMKARGEEAKHYEALGFRLDGELMTVPSLPQVMRVLAHAPIRPGVAYVDPRDASVPPVFRAVLEPAPPGMVAVPDERLPEGLLGPMIAAGFFPLSIQRAKHDFMHHMVLFMYPEFGKSLQKLQQIYSSGGEVSREDRQQRFPFFLEAFAFVPEAKREALINVLGPEFSGGGYRPTVTSQRWRDLRKEDAEIKREAEALLTNFRKLVTLMGGAAGEWDRLWHENFVTESLPSMAQRLSFALHGMTHPGGGPHFDLRTEVARLKVALFYSIGLTPQVYVEGATKHAPGTDHPLYLLYVSSGIGVGIQWGTKADGAMRRTFGSPTAKGVNRLDEKWVQAERDRFIKANELQNAQLAEASRALREFSQTQRLALREETVAQLAAQYALLSLPAKEITQRLRFAKSTGITPARLQSYLEGGMSEITLDLSDPAQRQFVDLVDSVVSLRRAGMGTLLDPRIISIHTLYRLP